MFRYRPHYSLVLLILALPAHGYQSPQAARSTNSQGDSQAAALMGNVDVRIQYESLKASCSGTEPTFEDFVKNGAVNRCASGAVAGSFLFDAGPAVVRKSTLYSWSKSGTSKQQKGEFRAGEGLQVCKLKYTAAKRRHGTYSVTPKFYPGSDRKIESYYYLLNSGGGGSNGESSVTLEQIELSTIPIDKDLTYRKQHQCDIDPIPVSTVVAQTPAQPQAATTQVSYQSYQSRICNDALGVHHGSDSQHTRVTFLRLYGFSWVFTEGAKVTAMQDVSGTAGQVVEAIAPNSRVSVSISCR